tara:strand:- start:92 stop:1144 length:1053 start_codon:yes stop_codon:yes gene_type:complete
MLIDEFSNITSYWKSFNSELETKKESEISYSSKISTLELVDNTILDKINACVRNIGHRSISPNDKQIWDIGWDQNYFNLLEQKDINHSLVPYYFAKYPFVRLLGKLYIDKSLVDRSLEEMISNPVRKKEQSIRYNSAEYDFYRIMIEQLIYIPALSYFKANKLYEPVILDLGAGTCHNIWHFNSFLRKHNIKATFIAADWSKATNSITKFLNENSEIKINYKYIDFNDNSTWSFLEEQYFNLIYTVASLEQLSSDPYPILKKISLNKPYNKKIINIEPMHESLSKFITEDKQIIDYIDNRNYLTSFLGSLLRFEMDNKNNLEVSINRIGYGSLFLDAYTCIKWKNNINNR